MSRATTLRDQLAFRFLSDGEGVEECLTYGQLDQRCRAIAQGLIDRNLTGQRALLLYPAGLDFITAFFGCLYAGVTAVPAYPPRMNRSADRIDGIVKDCNAAVALTVQSVLDRVDTTLEHTPDLRKIQWLATDTFPQEPAERWKRPNIDQSSLAFLQYTSGSTGTPKGVMLTHGNLIANCEFIYGAFEVTRSNNIVFWLPIYDDMGLVGGILEPVYVGRPLTSMSPVAFLQRPLRWLQAISKYRGAISGGPNFAYDLCVKKTTPEQRAQLDLSCWTLAFNGAEPVRAETIDAFCAAFEPCGFRREAFYPCYGLAEATLIVTGGFKSDPPVIRSFDSKALENGDIRSALSPMDKNVRRLVGSGQSIPGEKMIIVDPETCKQCLPDEVGEIWVQSASVAQGYWKRTEETQHTFHARLSDTNEGPFLRTGDLGFFQGPELFIAGRLKDLIIIRGLNHYPHDIELTVERSTQVVRPGNGAAFTVDVDNEPRLVIVYEADRHQLADADSVMESIRREVSREHELLVDSIRLLKQSSIPKTSSGKIQRHACRRAFLDNALDVVASWDAPREGDATATDAAAADGTAAGVGEQRPKLPASDRAPTTSRDAGGRESMFQSMDDEPSEAAANGFARRGRKQSTAEQVLEEVRKVAKERARGLTLDSNITELGLDSLERMEILTGIEERFSARFPEEVAAQLETCREFVDAVERYLIEPSDDADSKDGLDLPAEVYRFDCFPEYVRLRQNLELTEATGLGNPFFAVHERVTNDTTQIAGREYINFSSYNYCGMSGDPRVAQAIKEAVDRYGSSVSASRLVSGEKVIHRDLERAIADFVGVEDSIVLVGGHSTNESVIGHLFGPGDLILHDSLAHNSIIQGCKLSGARRRPFPHNDWKAVDQLLTDLRSEYRRVLIAIEGVYSMDGDVAPLPKFVEVKKRHKAFLMVDEAHSIGTLGETGRGIGEHHHVKPMDVDVWMGTLSKSFGSCGGYIAGCKALVEYLKYTAPGFVYSVGISPANAAAALASLRLLEAEPERVHRLRERARQFLELARARGLNTGMSQDSPVVPVIIGNSMNALMLSKALKGRGINVQPILYPAVEEKAARLRFFITSCHTPEQIRTTVEATAEELAKIDAQQGAAGVT